MVCEPIFENQPIGLTSVKPPTYEMPGAVEGPAKDAPPDCKIRRGALSFAGAWLDPMTLGKGRTAFCVGWTDSGAALFPQPGAIRAGRLSARLPALRRR